ncbi:hypothetical protein Taro_003732 [Colocasia esculenta]|uniref:Uncharacterized protein n=1 Tax=Colocasia esculenta TaxID=4460 RepID=A0A843TI01_COLES|nr:hypothetical protein [Colocasia esculenta]
MNLEPEIPSFSPTPPVQASSSFGGPSVPPELYTFLNDKFDALNTSIQSMSENFELRIQKLENSVSARFIEQKAASDHATQRFNRLIGTLADASVELKEHQKELEIVPKGILANSQADVFNTKETLSQISKTRLSFAHLVDDLESMKNLSAHIDEEMSALKKEFKVLNRPGWSAGSSSSSQPMSNEFTAIQAAMNNIFCKGSVVTTILGVNTMVQNKGRNVKKSPSEVDNRDRFQRNKSTDWDGRSTPNAECVDTPLGQVDTLRNLCDLRFLLDTWHPREKVFGALWAGWLAQNTGLFSTPERDRGARRILIATPGDNAFWLPPFWLVVCMRTACHERDGRVDVDRRITTGSRVVT